MIATSIEMSKHLLSLGLNPETADMYYDKQTNMLYPSLTPVTRIDWFTPAWSLSAMLELMKKANRLELHLRHDKKWNLFSVYSDAVFRSFDINDGNGYESLLEAAYSMLCWLIENKLLEDNYIKN